MPTHSDIPRVDTPARAGAGARLVRVPDDRAGQRLDNFLLGQLKGAPRSLVYKLVRSGQVRVNGGRARAERKLESGDEVRIPPLRLPEAGERGTPARSWCIGWTGTRRGCWWSPRSGRRCPNSRR